MNNGSSIYTRKRFGLDLRVWYTMLSVIIIAILLISYRVSSKTECITIDFRSKALFQNDADSSENIFYADQTIVFTASANTGIISWDFKDKTDIEYGQYIHHVFKNEGEYYVSVKAGNCPGATHKITILKIVAPKSLGEYKDEEVIWGGDSVVLTKTSTTFTCPIPSEHFDWNVDGQTGMRKEGAKASSVSFTFSRPGKYIVSLVLDHKPKKYSRMVIVQDPQLPVPAIDTTQVKTDELAATMVTSKEEFNADFHNMVVQVAKGIDYRTLDFNKYLCHQVNGTTAVARQVNKAAWATKHRDISQAFNLVCLELPKLKTRKSSLGKKGAIIIKKVIFTRDPDNNNCISLITIEYE